jgi:hypothetical protein
MPSTPPAPDPVLGAVKTYRYLRIALASLVVLLFASVAIEVVATDPTCVQGSISAYYYTPVRAVFVGVLVTMGISLIALKGSTELEDVLLNVAGMLAPGVAFIPTPDPGTCRSVDLVLGDTAAAVANNMQALFVAGLVIAGVVAVIARQEAGEDGLGPWERRGIAVTGVLLVGGAVWFYVARASFLQHAHSVAAVPMFLVLIAVVWVNARHVRATVVEGTAPAAESRYVRVYQGIAWGMLAALGGTVLLALVTGGSWVVLVVEVVLLVLFGAFWVVQTVELWRRGLRPPPAPPVAT